MGDAATGSVFRPGLPIAVALVLAAGGAGALVSRKAEGTLQAKQFTRSDLHMFTSNLPLGDAIDKLPNRAAWTAFAGARAADGSEFKVFIDPRSGAATNIMGAVPLLPGSGVGNKISLASLEQRLGRRVERIDAAAVADAAVAFIRQRRELLGVDLAQLGAVRATPITADLWQVNIPQQYQGIPVRNGHIAASISHGNLVTIGAGNWANVGLPDVKPGISADAALDAGFAYVEGRVAADEVLRAPALEILPFAPAEYPMTARFSGPVGKGYGHRLVWTFVFRRAPEVPRWEVMVDAHTGETISFQDLNDYAHRQVNGGVYPLANTEICPDNQTCGTMQYDSPMPFADTGRPAPNDFTNSAGIFDFTSGSATTTFSGRYFHVHGPAPLSESSSTGAIGLSGLNGQHDLFSSGASAGDTAAARTAFYELNKIAEMARGYLPLNPFLSGDPVASFVNEDDTCNAFYQPAPQVFPPFPPTGEPSLHFFRSGQDAFDPGTNCRNTGEIAAVMDHEWGHWLDDHDAGDRAGFTGEEYADIAALYRTQASCLGHGFFETNSDGCGATADGTGFNVNMAADGSSHCATNCSGVREADWAKHIPATPDNVPGFVRHACLLVTSNGVPVGFEPHCVAAPVDQAAWDLVTRDLTAPPFNMNSQTAFIVGNKLFYQGSANIRQWFTWTFFDGPADGCAVDNGYMQWLTADDDNGNLNDGTPHMTAIFNAFDRHGIACTETPRVNSGCGGGPPLAPTVTATPGGDRVQLNWTAVPGATRYWVFRTEGHAGCDYGKALIAEVTGLTYTDTEVAAVRPYSYNVVAAGASGACFSPASACVSANPDIPSYTIACSPSSVTDNAPSSCTVRSASDFAGSVTLSCAELPGTASCSFSPASVAVPANGTAVSTLTVDSGVTPPGTYAVRVRGNPSSLAGHENATTITWTRSGTPTLATFDGRYSAPSCRATTGSCDTGTSLIRGRGTLGPEPGTPNTIHTGFLQPVCADGSGTLFPNTPPYGSVDRVMVYTANGTPLVPGKRARVDVTVQARSVFSDDRVDLFATADASGTGWTLLATVVPTRAGSQVLSFTYTLPPGQVQALRVQLRYKGTASPCLTGPYNDRDDLVFVVGS
jgi:trimeric autotransporter adhesin